MPQANAPEDVSRMIGDAITSGDMDAALSLYEPDATFAMPTGFGEGSDGTWLFVIDNPNGSD